MGSQYLSSPGFPTLPSHIRWNPRVRSNADSPNQWGFGGVGRGKEEGTRLKKRKKNKNNKPSVKSKSTMETYKAKVPQKTWLERLEAGAEPKPNILRLLLPFPLPRYVERLQFPATFAVQADAHVTSSGQWGTRGNYSCVMLFSHSTPPHGLRWWWHLQLG